MSLVFRPSSLVFRHSSFIVHRSKEQALTENPLLKKMKLKPGQRAAIVNAPEAYIEALRPLPAEVELSSELAGTFDWVQLFVKTQAELGQEIARVRAALGTAGTLWITFPKGSSKIQTDLTRD